MNQVRISALNPIRFVPSGVSQRARYNSPDFNKEWFYESIKSWQTKVRYSQKVQRNDSLKLQVWVTGAGVPSLSLYDCSGTVIATSDFAPSGYNSVVTDGDLTFTIYDFIDFDFWSAADNDDNYYLTINIAGVVEFISEPIYVRDTHDGTLLIEYRNSYNKDYVDFEQTPLVFGMRVEGSMIEFNPKTTREVFQDQGYNTSQLSGTSVRQWKFVVGGEYPIPDYKIDQVSHILACDALLIDGHRYTQSEDTVIEHERDIHFPLSAVAFTLGEREDLSNYRFPSGRLHVLNVIEGPLVQPFGVFRLTIGYREMPLFAAPYPFEISGNTQGPFTAPIDIVSTVAKLNNWAALQGLSGTFVHVPTETAIMYELGSDEDYDYVDVVTMLRRTVITNTGTPTPHVTEIRFSNSSVPNPLPFMIFDQGSAALRYGYTQVIPPLTGSLLIANVETTPSVTPGVSQVVLYAPEETEIFTADGANMSTFTSFPPNIKRLTITGSNSLTSFNIYQQLSPYRDTLTYLTIRENPNLTNIGLLSPNYTTAIPYKLQDVDLRDNAITSSGVDNFANSIWDAYIYNSYYLWGKDFDMRFQTPPAPPTSASAAARDSFDLNNVTFLHD